MFPVDGQLFKGRDCVSHLPFQHLVQCLAPSRCSLLLKCLVTALRTTQVKPKRRRFRGLGARSMIVGDDLIAHEYYDAQCVRLHIRGFANCSS